MIRETNRADARTCRPATTLDDIQAGRAVPPSIVGTRRGRASA